MNEKLLFIINGWAGKNQLLDQFMIFVAKDLVFIIFVLTACLLGYLIYKKQISTALWVICSLAISYLILLGAALLYSEQRPFVDHHLTQLLAHATGKSFPSDHTTVTAAIGAALLFLTPFKKIGVAVALGAVLIGFSRVFVGVHYPIDIIGGLIVGALGGALTYMIKRLISNKTKQEKSL